MPFPVFRRVFEKLVNNRIVGHLEKCVLLSYFQYGFRSSWSTADLLAVVFDKIVRAFNRPRVTQAVALDISKSFDRVWHAGLLHKLKSYGISTSKTNLSLTGFQHPTQFCRYCRWHCRNCTLIKVHISSNHYICLWSPCLW